MDVIFISKLRKPSSLDDESFFRVWEKEAKHAIAALDAGRMKFIYKVAGKYELIGCITVESADQIDEMIHSLPIWTEGYMHIVESYEWYLVTDYRKWVSQLASLPKTKRAK